MFIQYHADMHVRLTVTHIHGAPRSKESLARAEGRTGEIVTTYLEDLPMRRGILVATFTMDEGSRAPMHLFDVRCARVSQKGLLLVGIERQPADDGYLEFAQGWWMRPEERPKRVYVHRDRDPDRKDIEPIRKNLIDPKE